MAMSASGPIVVVRLERRNGRIPPFVIIRRLVARASIGNENDRRDCVKQDRISERFGTQFCSLGQRSELRILIRPLQLSKHENQRLITQLRGLLVFGFASDMLPGNCRYTRSEFEQHARMTNEVPKSTTARNR